MMDAGLDAAVEMSERMARELREWINRNVAPPANLDGIVLVDKMLDSVDDVRYEAHQAGYNDGCIDTIDSDKLR